MPEIVQQPKTVQSCQGDAVTLLGLLQALDILNDNDAASEARYAILQKSIEHAKSLADDLDAAKEF